MQQEVKLGGEIHMQRSESMRLKEKKVRDLMVDKKRLVEVPYTASLAHTMNTLVANKVVAVPVAAPPGQWIGAGGSMIVESDKQTGAVRKHYIGMVTMLDIVTHIAGDDVHGDDLTIELDQRMSDPVSSIIGHSFEGLSLWTLNPNTSLLDCMEVLSKGVHRAMVPVDSQVENVAAAGVELVESASSYQIVTQMDVLKFLHHRAAAELQLQSILSRSVQDLAADTEQIYAITDSTKLVDAIKCLKAAMLNAVPIVRASHHVGQDDHKQHINGRCRKLIGTFSATDLKGCHIATLKSWLGISALAFTEEVASSPLYTQNIRGSRRELVTCFAESPLSEVIEKAVTRHVHRVWVVDHQGLLVGVVSLTDVIRVIRHSLLLDSDDM